MNEKSIEKNKITIDGISLWRICAYFIIYSFVGFVVETCFGVITKGELESRQSFLYGPFCGIYGIGAIIMILSLQRFKKNNYTIFLSYLSYKPSSKSPCENITLTSG